MEGMTGRVRRIQYAPPPQHSAFSSAFRWEPSLKKQRAAPFVSSLFFIADFSCNMPPIGFSSEPVDYDYSPALCTDQYIPPESAEQWEMKIKFGKKRFFIIIGACGRVIHSFCS